MSKRAQLYITLPPGRLVGGSVFEMQTKDMDGNPLVVKNGPDKGKPTERMYFAVAIPKAQGETHWAYTAWGAQILARGRADFPQGQAERPDFAWKIEDGDSVVPNKKGKKNADREGYPGHWVLRLSSGYAVKTYTTIGVAPGNPPQLMDPKALTLGNYVEVYVGVDGNDDVTRNPGVYLNPSMVSLCAYGTPIVMGPDVGAAGFGKATALPPGASLTPPAGFVPPTAGAGAPPPPGGPGAPPPGAPPPAASYAAPPPVSAAAPPPAMPVVPHNPMGAAPPPPGAGAPPPPGAGAPPPPQQPHLQMTPKANGVTYDSYRASGWDDATLIAHGLARMTLDDNIPF